MGQGYSCYSQSNNSLSFNISSFAKGKKNSKENLDEKKEKNNNMLIDIDINENENDNIFIEKASEENRSITSPKFLGINFNNNILSSNDSINPLTRNKKLNKKEKEILRARLIFSKEILHEINKARKHYKELSLKLLELSSKVQYKDKNNKNKNIIKDNNEINDIENNKVDKFDKIDKDNQIAYILRNFKGKEVSYFLKNGKSSLIELSKFLKKIGQKLNAFEILEDDSIKIFFEENNFNRYEIREKLHQLPNFESIKGKYDICAVHIMKIPDYEDPFMNLILSIINGKENDNIKDMIFSNEISHINIFNKKLQGLEDFNKRIVYYIFAKKI